MECKISTYTFCWNDILIHITYHPNYFAGVDHLEIRTAKPDSSCRPAIPLTETGYKSHFAPHGDITADGDPVAYVKEALAEAEQSPSWQAYCQEQREIEEAARQQSLF